METPGTPKPPPRWFTMRLFFAIIVFFGLNIVYALRVNNKIFLKRR